MNATRSLLGARFVASRNEPDGKAMPYGSPGSLPAVASSSAAESRTEIDTQCCAPAPAKVSPIGARLIRPRDGLRPNRPHRLAGMRIEPPPSVACPIGRPRAATIAAEPPDQPPGERSLRHGLRVGPPNAGSVVGASPNSLVLVRPTITRPALRMRATAALSP